MHQLTRRVSSVEGIRVKKRELEVNRYFSLEYNKQLQEVHASNFALVTE